MSKIRGNSEERGAAGIENGAEPTTITPATIQTVELPSGATVHVVYEVTFGELLASSLLALALIFYAGGKLFDRIRGVI